MTIYTKLTNTATSLIAVFCLLLAGVCYGQQKAGDTILSGAFHVAVIPVERQHQLYNEFKQFCSIPNTGEPSQMEKNVQFIGGMLKETGMNLRLLRATTPGVPPAVFAQLSVPGAKRTVLFYAHYDGQPVTPAAWALGIAPFQPVLYDKPFDKSGQPVAEPAPGQPIDGDFRLYSRGTGDDKAGVMVIIEALRSLLKGGKQPSCNIKLLFEGEEEKGSTHLGEILDANKQLLAADDWIIADGPVHPSGKPEISFGVRGDVNVEITTYGANRPLHSGHYGNWAPNPAWRLVQLLATMRDTTGHVLIKDWYTDVVPFTHEELDAVARIPKDENVLAASLGLAGTEGSGQTQVELLNQPSLNINGIQSADVGALSRNVIPTAATAALDLRLVLGNDWQRQIDKLVSHVQAQGYYVIDREPTPEERLQHALIVKVTHGTGYNAQRTQMSLPFSQELIKAVQAGTSLPVVVLPGTGGSLPLKAIEDKMAVHIVIVPIANYDDNQHAENENLRLQNLWDGIVEYKVVMERL
jgi:acetylornithine deacetylase/succinyl-diaminopimelate desuccinylase-like protein